MAVVTFGAVSKPLASMVPAEADHTTVCATVGGVTVAVHWSVAPESIVAAAHFTDTNCTGVIPTPGGGAGGITLTAVLPTSESCTLVAVTVIVVAAVTVGAVSTPVAVIAPADAVQLIA